MRVTCQGQQAGVGGDGAAVQLRTYSGMQVDWRVPIFHASLRRSSSHPLVLEGLDLPEDMVPQGWPKQLSASTLQIRMRFWDPTAVKAKLAAGVRP